MVEEKVLTFVACDKCGRVFKNWERSCFGCQSGHDEFTRYFMTVRVQHDEECGQCKGTGKCTDCNGIKTPRIACYSCGDKGICFHCCGKGKVSIIK